MAFLDWNAFVPGVNDLINGNEKYGIMSYYDVLKEEKLQSINFRNLKRHAKATTHSLPKH